VPELSLAELIGVLAKRGMPCALEGDPAIVVGAVNTLADAGAGELSFLANRKYQKQLATTRASAVLVPLDVPPNGGSAKLRCVDPYAAVAVAVDAIHGPRRTSRWSRRNSSGISPQAVIGPGANIAPGVSIEDEVIIGARATLYPGCFVGRGARIGDDVTLFPNVVIYDRCTLGNRVTIHAGTVVGEDGLGYAPVDGKWVKIPQAGTVEIGDDVEIGSLCAIDRATVGVTRIGRGTKLSNLVAVGHGVRIGEDCMIVAQVGLAGSVRVGDRVTMGGQVGVTGHVTIGNGAQIAGKSGIIGDVAAGQKVMGIPAIPIADARKRMALVERLPLLRSQVRKMQAEIDRLTELVGGAEAALERTPASNP